ncbi:hypothetical protein VTL71DRAFT_12090 [Oculimacula yallundae]|uniref:Uncharacterized protein n=1 Tax=Oculimacula yallundae TaxID=86028 RepID=A0ABR4CSI3_9HELO
MSESVGIRQTPMKVLEGSYVSKRLLNPWSSSNTRTLLRFPVNQELMMRLVEISPSFVYFEIDVLVMADGSSSKCTLTGKVKKSVVRGRTGQDRTGTGPPSLPLPHWTSRIEFWMPQIPTTATGPGEMCKWADLELQIQSQGRPLLVPESPQLCGSCLQVVQMIWNGRFDSLSPSAANLK